MTLLWVTKTHIIIISNNELFFPHQYLRSLLLKYCLKYNCKKKLMPHQPVSKRYTIFLFVTGSYTVKLKVYIYQSVLQLKNLFIQ